VHEAFTANIYRLSTRCPRDSIALKTQKQPDVKLQENISTHINTTTAKH